MCGIAGFWARSAPQAELASLAQAMGDAIRHRGPDAHGEYVEADCGLALAHRRLSILDLSPAGAQPMASHAGRWQIVFNGEIYNYQKVRAALEAEVGQIAWRGHSDTEVILAALETWGVERALKALDGMFALAAWDRAERRLILARDRLGEKPLYWGQVPDGTLLFGSELRALFAHPAWRGEIDRDALAAFMRNQCVPAPRSIFRNVQKLLPGHWLEIRSSIASSGTAPGEPQAYWSLHDAMLAGQAGRGSPGRGLESTLDDFERVLGNVVEEQMLADVPLGAFLSGGIDSSLIVALMQRRASRPVKTFTVGFDAGEFDESAHAREIARHLGCEHHEIRLTGADALAVVPEMAQIYDEPFADASQLPTALVARFARQHVTVALSGDGGDEMFSGYSRYAIAADVWRRIAKLPLAVRKTLAAGIGVVPDGGWEFAARCLGPLRPGLASKAPADKARRLAMMLAAPDFAHFYEALLAHWPQPEALVAGGRWAPSDRVLGTAALGRDHFEFMQAHDTLAYLPDDILVKVDRAAMAVSLETRAPLIDRRVLEFAWNLPPAFKRQGGQGKWLMRELLARHVPRTLFERPKQGFAVPLEDWLRGPLRDWAENLLAPEKLASHGLLKPEPIRGCWEALQKGQGGMHYRIWDVLMFQAWLEAWGGKVAR
jgi:asparagine synthase (glutamine-hydrolysing)